MIPTFHKIQSDDRVVNLFQDAVEKTLNPLAQNMLMQGNLLSKIDLAIGDNEIDHKLGRALTGWFITRQRGSALVYDKQDSYNLPAKKLLLNSSAAVSVDLYVF